LIKDTIHTQIENRFLGFKSELQTMKDRIQEMQNKLDIKPIKEEMNKLIELDHERNKRSLNLIIFGIKEQQEEDTLAIVKEELRNKSQINTTYIIEAKRLGKIIDHKDRLILVKVSCNDHKYTILSKSPSLKGSGIFINELHSQRPN
jgi:hypothetical protein